MIVLAVLLMLTASPDNVLAQYQRQVDTVPTDEDIGGGYQTPPVQRPLPRAAWWNTVDTGLLVVGLALSCWIVLKGRSRRGLLTLAIGCLLYFGFYREGCVCPIGAIQNVTVALTEPTYVIPYFVMVFFFLPLLLALVFGRVFCGGVCPLGAIQEIVLLKPVQLPRRLDRALGTLKYIYLVVAIWFAAGAAFPLLPAVDRDFIICRFDPFVGFFRLTGSGGVLIFGGALLVLGLFIGRPYCRFLCPYGALLAIVSRLAWRGVTITPDKELDCGLCAESCPYGAVEKMRAIRSSCLFCARCYAACPREPENRPQPAGGVTKAEEGGTAP